MIVSCQHGCGRRFDDEFRSTLCPHDTFAANDGRNRFAHHPESYISEPAATPASSPTGRDRFLLPCIECGAACAPERIRCDACARRFRGFAIVCAVAVIAIIAIGLFS